MILTTDNALLYIHPGSKLSIWANICKLFNDEPIVDELTIKMFNAFIDHCATGHLDRNSIFHHDIETLGVHTCTCGKMSSSVDYLLKSNHVTNYLSVHYLACHRQDIPKLELDKVRSLNASAELSENNRGRFNDMLFSGISMVYTASSAPETSKTSKEEG